MGMTRLPPSDTETLCNIERSRLRAIVAADFDAAFSLHASDFQLITPRGLCLSREQYFDALRDGTIRYLAWESGPIDVRLYDGVALIRYKARLQFPPAEDPKSGFECWHTDAYEQRDGRWQVVWSQATRVV
jgi:hypothetical protein